MMEPMPKSSYWQNPPMPREQLVLFSETLESRIPDDHPVRLVDEILDQLDWTGWESEYHGHRGQPPIHPSVLCKVLLFAMIRRVRVSRQIEYHLNHSIDFMWLASGRTIDHVTLCNFRRKHTDRIQEVYRDLVRLAIELGVAKLSDLCIDGSRILANANRHHTWTAASVKQVLDALDGEIAKALSETDANDAADDLLDDGQPMDKLPPELADLQTRRETLGKILSKLEEMDANRAAKGRGKTPARLSKTDPDARTAPNKEGGFAPNYTPMAVTESENGFIVGADLALDHVEHTMLLSMVDEIEAAYKTTVDTMTADGAYATGENLRGCEERSIELTSPLSEVCHENNPALREDPTQPVPDDQIDRLSINPQTKCFDKSAFVYDEATDCYRCPEGKELHRTKTETVNRSGKPVQNVHYTCRECDGCPLAAKCRVNPESKTGRDVSHDEYEVTRRSHREKMKTPEFKERYKRRPHVAETPFAVMKAAMSLRRFLLRGAERVRAEWHWACAAFNLKKLLSLYAQRSARTATATEI